MEWKHGFLMKKIVKKKKKQLSLRSAPMIPNAVIPGFALMVDVGKDKYGPG